MAENSFKTNGNVQTANEDDILNELIKRLEENNVDVRKDEKFLRKILKPMKNDVEYAFRKLEFYEQFTKQDDGLYMKVKKSEIKAILDSNILRIMEVLDKSNCKVIWIKPGLWEPKDIEADTILKVAALMVQLVLIESTPEQLGHGCVIIFDSSQVGMKHMYGVSTKFAKHMTNFITKSQLLPCRQVHNVNEPTIVSIIYAIFKVFLDERKQSYIKFHGSNLTNIHEAIGVDALPNDLGGKCKFILSSHWEELLIKPEVTAELQLSGYTIADD